jgi:addiction module HigA family antidote
VAITAPTIHPGEVLQELYLAPLGMSAGALARAIGVPRTRVERIIRQERGIGIDTALRLARYFGSTPELWTNMQSAYELSVQRDALAEEIAKIRPRDLA